MQGKYFAGLIKYVFSKEKILSVRFGWGVAFIYTRHHLFFLKLKVGCVRVWEIRSVISLSFSPKDKERLTDEYMTDIANEYLKGMEITVTQYLIVRHNDREHPHCHIVFNRINNFGQTIKDSNNFRRNIEVCRDITLSHKLYIPQGKGLKGSTGNIKGSLI